MQIQYRTPHTSLRLSLTHSLARSLRLTSALARSLKRSASTSGSPSSPSSGSHPIQAEEILSPEVVRPSPRWFFDQLAFDLPRGGWGVSVWDVCVWGGGGCVPGDGNKAAAVDVESDGAGEAMALDVMLQRG